MRKVDKTSLRSRRSHCKYSVRLSTPSVCCVRCPAITQRRRASTHTHGRLARSPRLGAASTGGTRVTSAARHKSPALLKPFALRLVSSSAFLTARVRASYCWYDSKPPALFHTLTPPRLTVCSCASTATSCATQDAAGRGGAASRGGVRPRLRLPSLLQRQRHRPGQKRLWGRCRLRSQRRRCASSTLRSTRLTLAVPRRRLHRRARPPARHQRPPTQRHTAGRDAAVRVGRRCGGHCGAA